VVVLHGKRVVAIGDLTAVGDAYVVDGTEFPTDTHRALKIVGAVFG
jgi:hypothetical protein